MLVTQGYFSPAFSKVSLCVLSGASPGGPELGGQKHQQGDWAPRGQGCRSWMESTSFQSPEHSQWAEGGAAEVKKGAPSFLTSLNISSETCGRPHVWSTYTMRLRKPLGAFVPTHTHEIHRILWVCNPEQVRPKATLRLCGVHSPQYSATQAVRWLPRWNLLGLRSCTQQGGQLRAFQNQHPFFPYYGLLSRICTLSDLPSTQQPAALLVATARWAERGCLWESSPGLHK